AKEGFIGRGRLEPGGQSTRIRSVVRQQTSEQVRREEQQEPDQEPQQRADQGALTRTGGWSGAGEGRLGQGRDDLDGAWRLGGHRRGRRKGWLGGQPHRRWLRDRGIDRAEHRRRWHDDGGWRRGRGGDGWGGPAGAGRALLAALDLDLDAD